MNKQLTRITVCTIAFFINVQNILFDNVQNILFDTGNDYTVEMIKNETLRKKEICLWIKDVRQKFPHHRI